MPTLRNHTPFPAMLYESLDRADAAFHTLCLRATLDLTRGGALAAEQHDLCLGDEHHGDPTATAARWESDLCPRKPATDVIVHAVARPPGGAPLPAWEVSVAVGARVKRLRVTGPRWWTRGDDDRWTLTAPLPTAAVPLRHELAWGGTAGDVRDARNPLGVGFAPDLTRARRLPAPQIDDPAHPPPPLHEALPPPRPAPVPQPLPHHLPPAIFTHTHRRPFRPNSRRSSWVQVIKSRTAFSNDSPSPAAN